VLAKLQPSIVPLGCAGVAASLAMISSFSTGAVAAYSVIAIGLCNSIMFPTVFTLAIDGLGGRGSDEPCRCIDGACDLLCSLATYRVLTGHKVLSEGIEILRVHKGRADRVRHFHRLTGGGKLAAGRVDL